MLSNKFIGVMATKNLSNLIANVETEIETIAEDVQDKRQKLMLSHKDIHDLLASLHSKQQGRLTDASRINDVYVQMTDYLKDHGSIDERYQAMKKYLKETHTIMSQLKKEKETVLEMLKTLDRELKQLNNDASSLLRGIIKPHTVSAGAANKSKYKNKKKKSSGL
jgi:chromosome segregation ATPase